jgi:hypothetical protein
MQDSFLSSVDHLRNLTGYTLLYWFYTLGGYLRCVMSSPDHACHAEAPTDGVKTWTEDISCNGAVRWR